MSPALQSIQRHVRPLRQGDNDFRALIFGPYSQEALEGKRPVIVFGSGAVGRNLVPSLRVNGIEPLAFCDNHPGHDPICGLRVMPFHELKTSYRHALIIVATLRFRDAIREQLLQHGFPADQVRCADEGTDPELLFAYLTFGAQECVAAFSRPEIALAIRNEMIEDGHIIEVAYDALSDDLSRELFVRRMALFASGADYESTISFIKDFSMPVAEFGLGVDKHGHENIYYFENDLITLENNEILMDCGAFDGDTVEAFTHICKRTGRVYNAIHSFEPDPVNYAQLLAKTAHFENIHYSTEALWDCQGSARFMSANTCSLPEGAALAPDGDITVSTTTLDDHLRGGPCTFIKMDIQGAEAEALRGARETLQRHRPRLAISAYHKRKDLYELPYLIHQLRPDYRMYLRHLGGFLYDTVLFAD